MAVANVSGRRRRVLVALGLSVALAVGGLLAGAALVQGAVVVLGALALDPPVGTRVVLSAVLLQGLAFGGVAAVYLRARGLGPAYIGLSVPDLRELIWVASGYVLALVGAMAVGIVAILAGLDPAQNRISEVGQGNPEVFLLLIPISFLLIGPGEELLFRGLVQGALREVFGSVPAILLASVIFAAAHVTSLSGPLSGRLVTVGLLLVPAIVLGAVYECTENIAVPALVHGAYNATLFGLAYASMKLQEAGAAVLV
jgi:membrane protease YdiL (CAAX protease family)